MLAWADVAILSALQRRGLGRHCVADRLRKVGHLDSADAGRHRPAVGWHQCVGETEPGRFGESATDALDATYLAGQTHLADGDETRQQRSVFLGARDREGDGQVAGWFGQLHAADGCGEDVVRR